MNAILFYVVNKFRLTGSTINAFEYYMAGLEHNKDLKLYLIDAKESIALDFVEIIENRCYTKDLADIFSLICIKKSELMRKKFDTVLVLDYHTIKETRGLLNAKKILVISEKHTDNKLYFYDKKLNNVTYYGEMPFHYRDVEYRMKCLFDRYKPLRSERLALYVNSPYNEDEEDILEKAKIHAGGRQILLKSKVKHEENLFEQFDRYLYYHANKWFDPHPRLFLECAFYGKDIFYMNEHFIKDGSYYRFLDVHRYGIKDRTLSKDDEIIRQLI